MHGKLIAAASLLAVAAPALAELREYCPDRPGIGTPSCIIDRGHVSVELGLADWTLDRSAAARDDQMFFGDLLIRYGLGDSTEVQLGWTSFGRDVDRDRATGIRTRANRAGDATVALRQNLRNPDGSAFSLSVMPFATLPVGRQPIGAGDWGAGLRVPVSYEIDDRFSVALTPEIDAAVDEDGDGRHLAYGAVAGLATKISAALSATLEYQLAEDRDPAGHATQQLAGLSLGWQPRDDLQLDLGANAGVRHGPDVELYVGVSRRF